ncbi:solute carrier family 25 member 40-like isoform X2 [Contarinia nasturtii]|uniref:solute carrier family 25 member 40-like isoform X2 n=1 Tax=Contarinia nasturtii TaxID=265458 RepID=UPI0012D459AE|nr:solute carrier family 25 member 40-like isoform X2 [Contarinia nasturtii]XP_031628361.1 solute carrier family 25 member 40-like isoform X2 [Contarinia nasturtii]
MIYTFKDSRGHEYAVDMDDKRFRIKPYQQMLSSCTGALLTSILMTPLDVVKTRLQTQQKRMASNRCYMYCNGLMDHLCPCPNGGLKSLKTQSTHYTGMIDAFYKISRHEGARSLWSGLSPTLVLALPATICYFVSYEATRLYMKDFYLKLNPEQTEQPFSVPLLAGMAARVFSVSVVSPLELIRTKMQSQRLNYYDVGKALKAMIEVEGVFGLWRGLGPTVLRDVPFSGVYWAIYESLKAQNDVTVPTCWFSLFGGATSGSIAAFLTAPFDVVKTHKQIEFGEKVLYADQPVKSLPKVGTIAILRKILHENGVRGIFAGVIPRVVKVAPACAIMITSFEYGKAFFFRHNVDEYIEKNGNL